MRDLQNYHWRILLVVSLVLFIGLLFGCSGGNSIAGKYVSRDGLDHLELKRDGTCYMEEYNSNYGKGTYEVNGTNIKVKVDFGWSEGKIEGNTIVGITLWGPEEKIWVKK